MCGDLEENRPEDDLFQRFLAQSRAVLVRGTRREADGPGLNAYLDQLFADTLKRCVQDAQATEPSHAYARMAMQSLALARLAGFLAGHVALNEDPLRKLLEAMMLGYSEAEMPNFRQTLDHHEHGEEAGNAHGHEH